MEHRRKGIKKKCSKRGVDDTDSNIPRTSNHSIGFLISSNNVDLEANTFS